MCLQCKIVVVILADSTMIASRVRCDGHKAGVCCMNVQTLVLSDQQLYRIFVAVCCLCKHLPISQGNQPNYALIHVTMYSCVFRWINVRGTTDPHCWGTSMHGGCAKHNLNMSIACAAAAESSVKALCFVSSMSLA